MKHRRQVPKGKKRPRGYGQQVTPADDIMKRLRTMPPKPRRGHRPAVRQPR